MIVAGRLAALGMLVCTVACSPGSEGLLDRPQPRPAIALTAPAGLCTEPIPTVDCNRAYDVETWLRDPDLRIVGSDRTPAGKQGAIVLTLSLPRTGRPLIFRAKWRAESTRTSLNVPRRELAAYAVQKLFLQPHEYVVPPAAGHCFPLADYRARIDARARPTFSGTNCVFGILSYWLEDVQTLPDAERAGWFDWEADLLDDDLFETNASYRASASDLNLLTFLIDHADSHWKQFLISKDPRRVRVYSVDNSMSFGAAKNPRLRNHWSEIKVPALPRDKVQRLLSLRPETLAALSLLEQYEGRDGRLVAVTPREPAGSDDRGFRWVDGALKVGLTRQELAHLRGRISILAHVVETDAVPLF